MSAEQNKAIVRRYREAHNANNLAALDKIVHMMFMSAFPDSHITTEDLIADGDKVVERFTFHGTNTGSFMGAPATGKHVASSGMSVFRIAGGKIVEHWGENDALGTMQQLGLVPAPGQ